MPEPDGSVASTSDESAEQAARELPPAEPERLIVLTGGGPLVVHLQIYVNGQSQRVAIERLLDEAMALATGTSADDAERPEWQALVDRPAFSSGILGNAPLGDPASANRAIEQYDTNRDKHVQREELAAFLAQDFARGRPFTVDWVAEAGTGPTSEAPLFALLDEDQDGQLSGAEMAAAPVHLRSRDVDANDTVTIAEVRPAESSSRSMSYNRDELPTRAFELRKFSLDSIYYSLSDLYEGGGRLGEGTFTLAPTLFAELYADGGGTVSLRELDALLTSRPDLLIKVNYAAAKSDRAPPKLELVATSDDLAEAQIERGPRRVTLVLPMSQLDVLATDQAVGGQRATATASLFADADVDTNEQLSADELGESALSFLSLKEADKDEDGQVSLDELTRVVLRRASYRELQVQARLGDGPDPLFGWLDVRPDGRLTSRELSGSAPRLSQLDKNADGMVAPYEIPDRLTCWVVRGARDRRTNAMLDVMPPEPAANADADSPRWLAAMDINSDGEVSRAEFLGTSGQFNELDANGDGFIDADEAKGGQPHDAASPDAQETTTAPD